MFHAKLTPLSLYRFSPQINLFNCFNPPPAPSAFICFGFVFWSFFSCPPSPSSYLVHKAFEQCFLSPVPLSGWLTFLSFRYPFGERGTARGRQYTNKAIPFYCSPIFPFSTMGSWQHHPVIPRSRAGKSDWCNPPYEITVSIFTADTNKLIKSWCARFCLILWVCTGECEPANAPALLVEFR